MGKFKVGDRIRRVGNTASWAPYGFESVVVQSECGGLGYIDNKGHLTIMCAPDWELITATKFKVGDRVRVVKEGLSTKGAIGLTATIEAISDFDKSYPVKLKIDDDGSYVSKAVESQREYTWCTFDSIEPAPLFAVGDKVRFKDGDSDTYIVTRVYVTDLEHGVDIYSPRVGDSFGYQAASYLEHAATDEEAGFVAVDGTRVSSITAGLTTGFTIPTDEEALPPKVASDNTITVTLTADTFEYEASLERIHKKLKKIAKLSNSLGISLTGEAA